MPAFMYVDSGADVTLIPKSFGELLGFRLESSKIQEIKGIGEGTVPVSQNCMGFDRYRAILVRQTGYPR